jgi:exodeoxyribonuclease VII large subunit
MYCAAVAEPRVYTVTEITSLVRGLLESRFRELAVQGEISNYRPAASGHAYFSLKDENSLLQVVMFRGRLAGLGFAPSDGQLVVARGALSVYEKRGVYQLVCESMSRAGEGAILALLEERKRALAAEGLFDQARKRPLPLLPSRVAVVTSPTGSVIRDILRVTRRRNAGLDIVVLPATVQGEGAAEAVARQIRVANRFSLGDVIIVARGGGSLEDLLPFYDERVVRAVASSNIPVISAIGHETDVSFCDLAADVRAPTPSAAAEVVSAARAELLYRVTEFRLSLQRVMATRTERIGLLLAQFKPETLLQSFMMYTQRYSQRLDGAADEVRGGIVDMLRDFRHRVELAQSEVSSRSPVEILRRGYAVVRAAASGRVLRDAADAPPPERLDIRLFRGSLTAEVLSSHGEDEEL